MKTYKETKQAVKELILEVGVDGVYNYHINELGEQGHNFTNIQNALIYFRYSPQAKKYR